MPSIKVRARGVALVPNYAHLFAGRKSFVGWEFDAKLGDPVEILDENGSPKRVHPSGWRKLSSDVELDVSNSEFALEYRKHLANGDLFPADEATASFANEGGFAQKVSGKPVKFDPLFGEDSPKKTKKEG